MWAKQLNYECRAGVHSRRDQIYQKKRRLLSCVSSPSKAFALPGAQTDGLKATLLRFPTNVLGLWTVVPRRPLPLAQVAPPATGGAPIAPIAQKRTRSKRNGF